MGGRNNLNMSGQKRGTGTSVERIPQIDPLVSKIMGEKKGTGRTGVQNRGRSHTATLSDEKAIEIRAVLKYTILRARTIYEHYGISRSALQSLRDWVTYANLREPVRTDVPEWAEEFTYD